MSPPSDTATTETPPTPVLPDFGGACLSNVVPAVLGHLAGDQGLPGWMPSPVAEARQVVLLVLDGLGSRQLAQRLDRWLHEGRDVALLIGGPDGLSRACLEAANPVWSLSALTLPHALVRIVGPGYQRLFATLAGRVRPRRPKSDAPATPDAAARTRRVSA